MNYSISTVSGKTKLKIIMLGSMGVGKSSIIDRYINDHFDVNYNATVGIDFLAKNVSHNAKNYRLQLWDTAGQQRFRALIPSYLKDAHCALIVFDVCSRASLRDVELWIKMFDEHTSSEGFIFLVGNKIDEQYREVTEQEGIKKAEELGLPYFQISAKTGQNVGEVFEKMIDNFEDKSVRSNRIDSDKIPALRNEAISEQTKQKEQEQPTTVQKSQQTENKLTSESSRNVKVQKVEEVIVLKNQKIEEGQQGKHKKRCC